MANRSRGQPPSVGIVTHYWPPHIGGIEVLARDQAERLANMGWNVTVFTSRLKGDQADTFDASVRIKRFSCKNFLESWRSVPVPLVSPTMLRALLQAGDDLDLIVAHGHVYPSSLYAAVASRLLGIPLVIVQHNPFVHYGSLLDKIESVTDRTVGRAVLEHATAVIAVSDFTMQFVQSIAPRANVTRIYPGIDLEKFQLPARPPNRKRPLFITVRRLVPRSGIDVLVHAWVEHGVGRRADLAIAGDGPLRSRLSEMSRSDPSIKFVGRLSDNDLLEFYALADVFVLPTVSGEGYGLALAEALASGLPAIVTDDGAPRELIEHGVTGLVTRPGDASQLAHQMLALAADEKLRATLTRNICAERLRLDRGESISRLQELFTEVIASRAATHDRKAPSYGKFVRSITRPLLGSRGRWPRDVVLPVKLPGEPNEL